MKCQGQECKDVQGKEAVEVKRRRFCDMQASDPDFKERPMECCRGAEEYQGEALLQTSPCTSLQVWEREAGPAAIQAAEGTFLELTERAAPALSCGSEGTLQPSPLSPLHFSAQTTPSFLPQNHLHHGRALSELRLEYRGESLSPARAGAATWVSDVTGRKGSAGPAATHSPLIHTLRSQSRSINTGWLSSNSRATGAGDSHTREPSPPHSVVQRAGSSRRRLAPEADRREEYPSTAHEQLWDYALAGRAWIYMDSRLEAGS